MNKYNLNRRQFLKAAGAAIAAPMFIPAHVLGRGGAVPPSEKIIMGCIGINHRGSGDLSKMMGEQDVQFVSICDIRKDRREAVKATIDKKYDNTDCKMYRDIREFLAERTDVDGVLIATSDHWQDLEKLTWEPEFRKYVKK